MTQVVSFDPRYLEWVRDGRKTCTTRYGEPIALGPALFRFEFDPATYVSAEVTALRTVRVADLTDTDAAAENFRTADDLRAALEYHYPGLPSAATVVVASFRTV
jgi:cytidine deaminase